MGPHVYDKAKYHLESVHQHRLPEEHADNHTVFFLRWLIEHDMMSDEFNEDSGNMLIDFRAGRATIHQVYGYWDHCLIDDMLSDDGNEFAMNYFEFTTGKYLRDYNDTLCVGLPSEFHAEYTEENYQRIKRVIDQRYGEWKSLVQD